MALRQRIELLDAQIEAAVPERERLRSALEVERLKVTYQREMLARRGTSPQQLDTPEMYAEEGRLGQQLAAIEGQIMVAASKRQELQTEIEFQAKCLMRGINTSVRFAFSANQPYAATPPADAPKPN
jgi:hypothetical protein